MTVDDRGVRPLTDRERRALGELQSTLADDPGLRSALRHGVPVDRTPRRGRMAVTLGLGCAAVTAAALAFGPAVAMAVALAGAVVLLAVVVRTGRGPAWGD